MFRQMPVLLFIMIAAIALFDNVMPLEVKSFLYAISLSIKSVIIFLLPIIIFSLLFKTATQLAKHATKIIFLIMAGVVCSNFLSTFLSHYVGIWVYHLDLSVALPPNTKDLVPTWSFQIPKIIANDKAMLCGIVLGILTSFVRPALAIKLSEKLDKMVHYLLRGLTYIIPLFVAGFMVKLIDDGNMKLIIQQYGMILMVILIAQFAYIMAIYFLANHFKISGFINSIKNMFPAMMAGFSTMSSAAAMPLTLIGTEKNAKNPMLARATIPATVNIHLIGDCFAIPILAYAILKNYGVAEPIFWQYLVFAGYFVLAKFSVAAVPGGGILVMLPILESYLGFDSQMMSLITALYILFDPVITSANVLGNGAFAIIIDRLQAYFGKSKTAWSVIYENK